MALAAPVLAAASPAYRTGTAIIVAPANAGDRYVPALARHGWNSVAVTETAHQPGDSAGYFRHITHRSSLRRTTAYLNRLGVQAVLAGSPAGTELADRTADDIRCAWHRLQGSSTQPPVLREHLAGTQYHIHTLTCPDRDGSTDHTITSIWSEICTPYQQICRADLISRYGILARSLALYTMRALTALGIRYGPGHVTIPFIPGRGPALLSLRTDPYADFASDALRLATGHDPICETTLLLTTGRRPEAAHQPHAHATEIALLLWRDGALDPALEHHRPPDRRRRHRPHQRHPGYELARSGDGSSSLPATGAPSTKTTK
jgi:hypothetical protein